MKIIVREGITCKDIKKHIPKRYGDVVPTSLNNREESVNIVIFPYEGGGGVITGRYINQAYNKIKDTSLLTIFFARCFSMEAKELINSHNSLSLSLNNFEWTDESWFVYKGGSKI